MPVFRLDNGVLRADVLPGAGGGLLRFDAWHDGGPVPVFRTGRLDDALREPNALACYPLVPWSNRIGGGRFAFDGRVVEVPRTRDDEPYPLHGHGWRMPGSRWPTTDTGSNWPRGSGTGSRFAIARGCATCWRPTR